MTLIVNINSNFRISIYQINDYSILKVKEKETQTLEKLESARNRIRSEVREMKDRLKLTQEKLQLLKEKAETEDLVVEDAI
jgi:gas vesicle protein